MTVAPRPLALVPLSSLLLLLSFTAGSALGAERGDVQGAKRQGRDPAFDKAVADAIDRGSAFLYDQMLKGIPDAPTANQYPLGIRALSVYALIESGVAVDAPVVKKLFLEMQKLPINQTYSVALYAMALDAYQRKAESGSKGEGAGEKRDRKSEPVKAVIEKLVTWLINARSIPRGTWGYNSIGATNPMEWVDFSNTQFAVLGLQVGIRNGINIPDKVLREVVFALEKNAIERTDGEGEIFCAGGGWWTDSKVAPDATEKESGAKAGGTRVNQPTPAGVELQQGGFSVRAKPLDWPYRPSWQDGSRARGGSGGYSMLAAATSCLMVAREGLARSGSLKDEERKRIDGLIASGVVGLRRGYESLGDYVSGSNFRNGFYDLYSFEKVMDLGGIVELDGIDWYRDHVLRLLAAQRQDGGWGTSYAGEAEYRIVSSSLALLFLCRATRHLRVETLERILTGDGPKATDVRHGKVFLASKNGLVELRELFELIAADRTRSSLELAKEAVASAPPEQAPELLPFLIIARNGTRDSIDQYVSEQITALSGLAGNIAAERAARWIEEWRTLLRHGQEKNETKVAEISRVLRDPEATGILQVTAIDVLGRIGSLDAVPVLLEALLSVRVDVRSRAANTLRFLTNHDEPFNALADAKQLADQARAWDAYWKANEADLRFRIQWERLSQALNRAEHLGEREACRAKIVALGERALPKVEEVLARERYAFDWVLVWETLAGKKRGI